MRSYLILFARQRHSFLDEITLRMCPQSCQRRPSDLTRAMPAPRSMCSGGAWVRRASVSSCTNPCLPASVVAPFVVSAFTREEHDGQGKHSGVTGPLLLRTYPCERQSCAFINVASRLGIPLCTRLPSQASSSYSRQSSSACKDSCMNMRESNQLQRSSTDIVRAFTR